MKRNGIICLLLCAALLTACGGSDTPAATPTPQPTEETAAPAEAEASPEAASESPSAVPEAASEPPSTVPDPTSAPEKNGMYDLLCGLMDSYHPGTAGSSLTAAWYAASIVDWSRKNPGTETADGARAWDRPMENEFGESLKDKLDAVYVQALRLTAADKGLLADCGFPGAWDYTSREVRGVYQALYDNLGLTPACPVLIWSPDENAEGFVISAAEIPEISPASLTAAMADRVLLDGSAITSLDDGDGTLRVDMNAAFAAQIRSMGTSGEYLYMGSLVNTLLDACGADSLVLTVEGEPLETGHEIYDYPLSFFEEIG